MNESSPAVARRADAAIRPLVVWSRRSAGPAAAARAWRGKMALVCAGLLGIAMLFGEKGPVVSRHLPVPRVCLVQALVRRPCPACGLTRSVARALCLDFAGATAMHPAGPWVTLALGIGVIWFTWTFLTNVRPALLWQVEVRFVTWADYTLVAVLLAIWMHRLILNTG